MQLLHVASQPYQLQWQLHPDVILVCALILGVYFYAITSLRRYSDAGRIRRSQVLLFTLGVAVIYAGSTSPVHELSEGYLASVHMLQHLLYTLVAPPLLIAGTPAWLLRVPLRDPKVFRVARFITLPLFAFAMFNAVQLGTHLPEAVDLSLRVHSFHFFIHAVLVATALLMWWPILSPMTELPRLAYPLQMAYLFVQSLLPSVLAAFITFSESVFYGFYATAPRVGGLSAIEDQQYAGFVMKVLGSIILWSFIVYAFFRWYATETANDRQPRWDEVREEMRQLGLPLDEAPR